MYATLAVNGGVPLKVVSRNLGHALLAITADVYAAVGDEARRMAADELKGLLGGA